jgi:hypothetical protein
MNNSCTPQGCLFDKAYAIVNPKNKKVYRISFSESLLKHIITQTNDSDLVVGKITFRLGKELVPNEDSPTGIYALVKAKTNWTLRIPIIKDVANYICDFDTRKLRECIITKIEY